MNTRAIQRNTDLDAQRNSLASLLEKASADVRLVIPKHLSPDRLCRLALSSIRTNKKLAACTPASFVASVMSASMMGLEVNTPAGLAYLVPYEKKDKNGNVEYTLCQLIVGYKGFVALARNSGCRVSGHAVYHGDDFDYDQGTTPFLRHKPKGEANEKKLSHAYAIGVEKDGGFVFEVLTRSQIDRRRARSMSGRKGPWVTDYEAMAVKSAVRALARWLPQSPELAMADALETHAERRGTQFGAMDARVLDSLEAAGLDVPDDEPEVQQLEQGDAAEPNIDWDRVEAETNAKRDMGA
jgi:recombination protein RecT